MHPRPQNSRTVAVAFTKNAWLQDIDGALTLLVLIQYVQIRERLESVVLNPSLPDIIAWRWCSSGNYSARSTYGATFCCQSQLLGAKQPWSTKTPAEFNFSFGFCRIGVGLRIAFTSMVSRIVDPVPCVFAVRGVHQSPNPWVRFQHGDLVSAVAP
jgi:hypothetical protein